MLIIFLLGIHLFNTGGYVLCQHLQEYQLDKRMNMLVSQNLYDPNSLIEVKVAQHLPGVTSVWSDYKNIDGQLQLKNASYNYVKMKVTPDTLYLMVIKNYEKTRLTEKNIVYARQLADIPQNDKGNNAFAKKAGDVKYSTVVYSYHLICFKGSSKLLPTPFSVYPTNPYLPVAGQPPEAII